ncbi:MAG: hypothetical protein PHG32_02360, partial [Candidatus Cloacimonetes bacterium]|nr:hypothetical protein [Candidatus Cloacimonadota bacterium]
EARRKREKGKRGKREEGEKGKGEKGKRGKREKVGVVAWWLWLPPLLPRHPWRTANAESMDDRNG